MFEDAHNPEASEPPDWRIARTERRLRRLEQALDWGMERLDLATRRARVVTEAMEAGVEPPKGVDMGDDFERVFRGVRFAIVLEAKLDDDLFAMQAGTYVPEPRRAPRIPRSADPQDPEAKPEPDRQFRRDQIHGHVLDLVHPMSYEPVARERIYENLHERLYETERYDLLLDLSTEEAVETICKDLGVRPQYERWEGLDWPPWRIGKPAPDPSAWKSRAEELALKLATEPEHQQAFAPAHTPPETPTIIPRDLYSESG
jgi:hypothetical protein